MMNGIMMNGISIITSDRNMALGWDCIFDSIWNDGVREQFPSGYLVPWSNQYNVKDDRLHARRRLVLVSVY